ncbi:MAG TPA: hypothetical protein VE398_20190 [Acidobacteriota bacterium]|nr:hypothetical protein [Acidobacteriota bacterium]
MREFTKSILSTPLSALQDLTDSLISSNSGMGGAQEQISDMIQAVLQASDDIQRDFVDMGFRLFGPESWTPSGLARATADLSARMAEGMRYADPSSEGVAAWRELGNKVEIFRLVKYLKSRIPIPEGRFDLHEFVDKCYHLGAFPALWAIEGLGHDYAHSFRPYTDNTRGLLTDPSLDNLTARSFTMLHAGMGLGFAQELLEGATQSTPASEVRQKLELIIRLCRQNSRPGYEGASMESLGLFTRNWRRKLMKVADEQLLAFDEDAAAYFWRGAGRALFFQPVNFVPLYGSIGNAIRMSKQESPHELARRNTMAGVAWGFTVVNMEQPEIMEALLSQHGDALLGQDAFTNGVVSSIIMRQDTTPDAPFIKDFIEHTPDTSKPQLEEHWDTIVRKPAEEALRKFYPVLRDHHRLGEVFRYQSLSRLVESLAG